MRAQTEGGRLGGDAGRLGAARRISFLHSRQTAWLHLSRSARNATSYCILQPGPGLSKNRVSTQPARHRLPHPPAEPARRTRLPRSAKPLTKARPVSPTAKTRGTSGSNLASSSGESTNFRFLSRRRPLIRRAANLEYDRLFRSRKSQREIGGQATAVGSAPGVRILLPPAASPCLTQTRPRGSAAWRSARGVLADELLHGHEFVNGDVQRGLLVETTKRKRGPVAIGR